MSSLKISWRMTAAFAALTALLLVVAALALAQMATMRTQTQSVTERWLPSAMAIQRINAAVIELRSLQIQHVLNFSGAAMTAIEASMSATQASYAKDAAAYQASATTDEDRQLFETFTTAWAGFVETHEKLLALSRDNSKDAARSLIDDATTRAQYAKARESLAKLVALNERGASAAVDASSGAYFTARRTTLGAAAVAVLLALLAAWALIRSIVPPLRRAVEVADRVASGDLTGAIDVSARDETGQLLQALARMQTSLASTANHVRGGAESVATASAEIAHGNIDLSQRTEEQASALQQIASTMDELAATVRNNVDNAMQAKELANGASLVAAQGGTVIGEVVRTMKDINESSKKISDIIGVIDAIAFQTNILALNAAVEAARAGEQGRGFAVVASEVRTLAQSSASAAQQIKDLITNSVDQVDRGSSLVDRAGVTMGEIVDAVRRVSVIVNEISVASVEQSDGVAEIGKAVSQMDTTTQQNAALVEESAAAAESLKHQARQLVEAVEVFKVATIDKPQTLMEEPPGEEAPAPERSVAPETA